MLLPALASASNTVSLAAIELVDIGPLHGPDLTRSQVVPSGSQGYAHRTAGVGWGRPGRLPDRQTKFHQDTLIAYQDKKYGCWRCTMSCGGHMRSV